MRYFRLNTLAWMLAASCAVGLAWNGKRWRTNISCPVLQRCSCVDTKGGAAVACRNISSAEDIYTDMTTLKGVGLKRLTLWNSPLTELGAEFANLTITEIVIRFSPLHDIGETALDSMNKLRSINLEKTMLKSLPFGLSAAKSLRYISATKNIFKVLNGTLLFPELRKLELTNNNIEEVDEAYLVGMPKLEELSLTYNKIKHLSPILFKRTRNLLEVRLSYNRLTVINSMFNDLRVLQAINLKFNAIIDIKELAQSRMPYLKEIYLEHNNIQSVPEFASSMIEVLHFGANQITDVAPGSFKALQRLRSLNLSKNKIRYLNESVFGSKSSLEVLNMMGNKITNIAETFKNAARIIELKLSSNGITSITEVFRNLRSLRKLSLRDNRISMIPDDNFKDNTQLLELNLNDNNILWIGKNAFRGLVTLTGLRLRSNRLASLNGSIRHLPSLKYFDAAFNQIQHLENGEFGRNTLLNFVSLMENNISNVEGAFRGAVHLQSLSLAGNRIELLRRSDFTQNMAATPNVTLHRNPLLCDCRLAWLVRKDSDVSLSRNPTCESPPWLKETPLQNLREEDLITWEEDCQHGCRCTCREGEFGTREFVVNCSSAALNRVSQIFPEGTTELDLRDNNLEEVDGTLRKGAPDIEVLNLRNNRISSLTATAVPEKVCSLDLRNNRLKKLPYGLVAEIKLTSLWLSSNPFQCDCDDYLFRQWVEAHGDVIRDAEHIMCAESLNALVSKRKFMTLGQKRLCPVSSATQEYMVYLLCVFVVLAVILALSAAYIQYERQLKALLFSRGVCTWAQCIEEEDIDAEKLFDVFLSFSSRDAGFVHDQILPGLEAFGLSYCTYERNFKGGFLLQDVIRDAVACSRRTLLILTQKFVESEWCRREFRLAHQQALEDNINRLIIVLVEEVEPGSLDEDLRLYIRTANYLRWNEPNFWERLYCSLRSKGSKKKFITNKQSQCTFSEVDVAETTETPL